MSIYPQTTPLQRIYYISVSLLAICALIWVAIQVGHYFSNLVLMLGLVILFTYLLLGPVNFLHNLLNKALFPLKKGLKLKWLSDFALSHTARAISILAVYVGFIATLVILSVTFIPTAVNELNNFIGEFPKYTAQAEDWLSDQPLVQQYLENENKKEQSKLKSLEAKIQTIEDKPAVQNNDTALSPTQAHNLHIAHKLMLRNRVLESSKQLQAFLLANVNQSFGNIVGIFASTISGLVYTLTALVLLFYLLLDGKSLKNQFILTLPKNSQNQIEYFINEFHQVMFGFIKGQLILGIFTGSFMFLVYTIFDVPYALLLGAGFALAEIIPVVGTWIGQTPAIIVMLFMHDPIKLIMVLAISYIFQTIKDNILAPQVIGENIGLHPVSIIISLLICGQFGGLLGIIYAIPLASMVNVGWRCLAKR